MQLYYESKNYTNMSRSLHWDKWQDILPNDIFIIDYFDVPEEELVSMTHRANKKWKTRQKKKTHTELLYKNIILVYEFEVMHTFTWHAVCDYLRQEGWLNILIIDGGFEFRLPDKHQGTPGNYNVNFAQSPFFYQAFRQQPYKEFEEAIAEKDTLFSSLARRAQYSRIRITVDLLQRKLDEKGYISCGWSRDSKDFFTCSDHNNSKPWLQIIPQHLQHKFPLSLGHQDDDQWEVEGNGLDKVCLNVAQETHVGWMYQEKYRSQTKSDRAHFTEKSAKPFYYWQLPLVFGTPFQVGLLQSQGFDMFDDIFDLSYDKELDVIKREKMFVDQVELFCKKPIAYWQDYMLENKQRLVHNRKNLLFNYKTLRDNVKLKIKRLNNCS